MKRDWRGTWKGMNLKKLLVTNLVISSVALTSSGIALGITHFKSNNVEPVTYECTYPVEEVTEPTEDTESIEMNNLGEFMLTAYCPCEKCCGKSDGITATGTKATQGRTIAVDPEVIPYGTEVVINGDTYIAEDCGGAIKGNRIDVYFDSHREALEFGVKYAEVYVVRS